MTVPAGRHREEGRRSPWGPRLAGAGFLVALAALLQAAVDGGLVSSFLVPPPTTVWSSFGKLLAEEHLLQRFAMTAGEALAAALVAIPIGGLVGWALSRRPVGRLAFTGWIVGLSAAPSLLLYPFFLVTVGRNAATIIVLGVISALPPIALKTCEGLVETRRVLLDVGLSFGLSRFQQFRLIQLPAAVPTIFSGIRIGLIDALITVVGVEYLIGYGGLGALIPDLAERFEIPAMYGAIAFVILASAGFQILIGKIETWLRPA